METQTSDKDRKDPTGPADAAPPPAPPSPPVDDGRFAVPWALPDEPDDS